MSADGGSARDLPVPPHILVTQKGELLRHLSPIQALRRCEYTFTVDPKRFDFMNGEVPAGAFQFRGACLLAWGAFYSGERTHKDYAARLLPCYRGKIPPETYIYKMMRNIDPMWAWNAYLCARSIEPLIAQLQLLSPELI